MKANKNNSETLLKKSSPDSRNIANVSRFSPHSFVLRRGLKKNQEFLGLYSILRTLFPRRSSTFLGLFFGKKSPAKETSMNFETKVNSVSKFNLYIRQNRFIRIAGISSLAILAGLAISAVAPIVKVSDNTEATTGTATSSETTLSISTGNAIKLSLTPNSVKGTFASASGTITVSTNNYSGYDLKLSTRSNGEDNTSLVNTDDASSKFTSLASTITQADFSAENNTSYNGKWGYNFYNNSGSSNTDYNPSPSNTTGVSLDSPTGATSTSGNTYTLSIGARAGLDLPAGTYSNTFIISAVAKAVTYNITYNSNGGTAVASTTGSTLDTTINLSSTVPTRDSYNFKGWCSTSTSDDTCSGTIYNPDGNGTNLAYGIDQTSDNTTTLYAMWKQSKIYIQDFTKANCQAQASSAPVTVYDRRDENDYTVRYINGACWMTQNLRITGTISKTDSNFTRVTTFNPMAGGDLSTSGNTYTAARAHVPTSTDISKAPSGYTADMIGVWYNYCAASAGQVCSQSQADATQDICPKNWHLPTNSQQSGITSYASAYNPIYGGVWYDGLLDSATTYGRWWSATTCNIFSQYYLYYSNGSLNTSDGGYGKYAGLYIRCTRTS